MHASARRCPPIIGPTCRIKIGDLIEINGFSENE
jgi:hypothetical protein